MRIVRDDQGREIALERPPRRVVSLVPSISETLYHLGLGARLIAVTRYCTDPVEARQLPRCGGTKNPDCEKIVALEPDLVCMSEEENRIEDFARLADAGLTVFVSFPRRVEAVADWVRRLGALLGVEPEAGALAAEIEECIAAVREAAAGDERRRRVFCPIWKKPWMSFNADTYTHSILEVCGGENVCADAVERYCTTTIEAVLGKAPDLVLLPDEPYPFGEKDIRDLQPLLEPSGPAKGARLVDGQALSWYGARTPRGLRIIREALFGGN